jgi:Co/Zn/Cd efflux system component
MQIIMNANPSDVEVHELYNEILALKTVEEIHDFHCWS